MGTIPELNVVAAADAPPVAWICVAAFILILVAIGAVLGTLRQQGILQTPTSGGVAYQKKPALVSRGEHAFLSVLDHVAYPQFRVFTKVRLADLIEPPADKRNWRSMFNRITAKHVDFVLCRTSDLCPVLAIELNDKTHQQRRRMARDNFVRGALNSAGLPLLEIRAQAAYDVQGLRAEIYRYIAAPIPPRLQK